MALRRIVVMFAAWLKSLGWLTLTQFHWFDTSSASMLLAATSQFSGGTLSQLEFNIPKVSVAMAVLMELDPE